MSMLKYVLPIGLTMTLCSCLDDGIRSFTINSTPIACATWTDLTWLCLNTTQPGNDIATAGGLHSILGFQAEWGTSYELTVAAKSAAGAWTDGGSHSYELISIDKVIEDPIGTEYKISSIGRLISFNRKSSEERYFVSGPYHVFCDSSLCGDMIYLHVDSARFKLVETNGEREIELIEFEGNAW